MTRLFGGCLLLLGAATGSFLSGCDSATDATPASETTAQKARADYRATLASIDQYAASNGLAYDSPEAIVAGTRARFAAVYGEGSDQYRLMDDYLMTVAASGLPSSTARRGADDLPEHLEVVSTLVDEAVDRSETVGEVSDEIDAVIERVEQTDWSAQEKEEAIVYAVVMDETARYLTQHGVDGDDPVGGSTDDLRLDPRVRCGLGVVGSAIAGGLAGSALGPIGGGLGVWSGGLVGIATFCS